MHPIGAWRAGDEPPAFSQPDLFQAAHRVRETAHVVEHPRTGQLGIGFGGSFSASGDASVFASLSAVYPEWLGDRSFTELHNVRFPYVSGAMANGIATTRLVRAMAEAGFLGFFGAAGLSPDRVAAAIDELDQHLTPRGLSWGSNLIHSPNEPALEDHISEMYIRRGVRRVSAAAYMNLTPMIVRYAYTGLRSDPQGRIHRQNYVFAKISHPEVARRFMEPAPAAMLNALVEQGKLTAEEGRLARSLPVAEDYTVESDSGGHTDNRPLTALFPTILSLRDEVMAARGYRRPIRVGAAGGLGTPTAVAAAFSLGAAYVLTGSVNQACVESGLHESGRKMLASAGLSDVIMAPAADMFELGVEVQVLKRGTMFANRAKRLYHLYRGYDRLEDIPTKDRQRLEKEILRDSVEDAWASTARYWRDRDPAELARAQRDPKHKMALLFRAYLGQSSKWAIAGDASRAVDYQIWCGPAMGAFNRWTRGSFLEAPERRTVVQVARNLLEGAAVVTRAQQLRSFGVPIPAAAFDYRPRTLA
ncbi:MAG: PfaD family polyunsaturated fatty acid/polyketide biosynthesis protein [Myxococcota bacterium]